MAKKKAKAKVATTSETKPAPQHTPYAWQVIRQRLIADITGRTLGMADMGVHEFEANARLMAAAPSLLVCLEEIITAFDFPDSRGVMEAIEASRDVVKKAKGE